MVMLGSVIILSLIISMILMFFGFVLSSKFNLDSETLSPFECGFNPMFMSKRYFSIRFFLVAIIFLIFDVELVLMMPIYYSLNNLNSIEMIWIFYLFLLVMTIGLFYEWNNFKLEWSK
uniref:NADH dehydrogenase subunit 3 n=1 Tax=Lamproglena orientalis TaxID=342426 RepID=UPI00286AD234|nr:NADH dehydrogenase subunit 3 [Lamproglena orientalis]YP_010924926.1 NADH dehydrogenase subunit 3 [Lamproglena orientalis]WKB11672.1 NADH dehydrogenase subunit 3 [Lamproglena orientalis]WKB11685.1 NADH dehydrogenase subunit 3 [Lamproglena orientalis]WKB11698.1 NADH dehydrogenase subunit 3 [Lamproglena orientalis]WKB11711.1 NADH dehydrogenase subunit 3 [Lamproglena orientalis]WKB11724.1 NADH dehydrogenase subunit 3 [Lamproglena orientalis]